MSSNARHARPKPLRSEVSAPKTAKHRGKLRLTTAAAHTQAYATPRDLTHAAKVKRIARELREWRGTQPVSLKKKAPPHQVPKGGDLRRRDEKIDISELDQILLIDPKRRICVAEPGVTFIDLVNATLEHGLVPIIVPEFKKITIGGAVSGCSIESMSFKYGGFHDTSLEYEIITGDGNVITARPEGENALTFQMMHGAFGTLGIVSKLVFKLIPGKRFVQMTYRKFSRIEDYVAEIRERTAQQDFDFMDGMIHSPTELVLSLGKFVDKAPYTTSYEWMNVYYLSTRQRTEDYLTTLEYYFRYDRGVTNVFPKSFLGRLFFGKLGGSTRTLALAEKLPWLLDDKKPTITLDVFIPARRAPEFLSWYQAEFGFFPLWCVPYKRVHDYEWLDKSFYDNLKDDLFLDLAIYGMKQTGEKNYHRIMEEKLREIGGVKTLIAHNYYPEDEFWQIWNKENYDAVKAVTDPRNRFRNLYSKTCRAVMGLEG
jgi:FAD/FMN-containing dehydrogenase